MARRKRASMREGPLADLFRSTTGEGPGAGEIEEELAIEPPEFVAGSGAEVAAPRAGDEGRDGERRGDESAGESRAAEDRPAAEPPAHEPDLDPADDESAPTAAQSLAAAEERAAPRGDEPPAERERVPDPEPSGHVRDSGERLSRVFAEEPMVDRRPARHGRDEYEHAPRFSAGHTPVIRVVGVGGGGVNAINRMVEAQIPGVEFMAVNTDLQSLQICIADSTVHIGGEQTRGLGAGADPELGYRAAFAEQDRIKRLLKGSDMVFVAAGAGGGTGTGAAPVVARLAREVGALTVGIITRPFSFEGSRRGKQADDGIDSLAEEVDTLIVVPNDRLLEVLDQQTTMIEAFQVADDVLRQGVQGISDLVTLPSLINLDFADVRTIMSEAGQALLGIGMGNGDGRAQLAAEKAISSPLLETSMEGARAILLSITGGPDLSLIEVSEAANVVNEAAHQDANIIYGANVDEDLDDQVWVTVVATRFDGRTARAPRRTEETGKRGEGLPKRAERSSRGGERPKRRGRGETGDLDVPEFLPN